MDYICYGPSLKENNLTVQGGAISWSENDRVKAGGMKVHPIGEREREARRQRSQSKVKTGSSHR